MHPLQKLLIELSKKENLGQMTLREIGKLVGETHPQKISHHLKQLEKKGLIHHDKQKGILKKVKRGKVRNSNFMSLPILGTANCGPAELYADDNVEGYLKVSSKMLKKKNNVFILRAEGLSMNRADVDGNNIEDGDFVLVDYDSRNPKSGDYVVSVIDGLANIKKFVKDESNEQIILVSESTQQFDPIYIHPEDFEDYMVNGKVVQVIKKPKL